MHSHITYSFLVRRTGNCCQKCGACLEKCSEPQNSSDSLKSENSSTHTLTPSSGHFNLENPPKTSHYDKVLKDGQDQTIIAVKKIIDVSAT